MLITIVAETDIAVKPKTLVAITIGKVYLLIETNVYGDSSLLKGDLLLLTAVLPNTQNYGKSAQWEYLRVP